MKPLTELCAFLASWLPDLRRQRNYAAILEVEAVQTIVTEAQALQAVAVQAAYTAEQADLEAARLLRESLADGRIDLTEIPALRTALRHVTRSAASDHQITEHLA
jgi:hypothetical protein